MAECNSEVSKRLEALQKGSGSTIVKTFKGVIYFKCKCGELSTVSKYTAKHLLCKQCVRVKLATASTCRTSRESVEHKLSEQGCTLVFEGEWHKINALSKVCIRCSCGTIFERRYSRLFEVDKSGRPSSCKCMSCTRTEKFSGPSHPNWKGGTAKSRSFKVGSTRADRWWSRAVKRQFGYSCIISGIRDNLTTCSHHLNAYGSSASERHSTRNGVCLSKELHHEFHCRFDSYKGTCTREQFSEFYKEKTGLDFEQLMKGIKYEDCPYSVEG